MITDLNFYNGRIATHGHVSKDPSKRYITINEMGIIADTLCSSTEPAEVVKLKVKEYLLRKAYTFSQLSTKI